MHNLRTLVLRVIPKKEKERVKERMITSFSEVELTYARLKRNGNFYYNFLMVLIYIDVLEGEILRLFDLNCLETQLL